eukprot:gnl/TRDRNA2_/TRDRNA2_157987_c0_seq2.p1 gnl/TRDRNA2_/TRDRNA2_157987_c0~~gnl/TRDRNA2_/TRDRNA2_157987_c0_seq2.p1  ORF type:complete len:274 (+),score=39.69 gnl/TRDRNA2_/TRDRNA2_157987_c0_seq2:70-891(+)
MNAAGAFYDGKTLGGIAGHTWARYVALRERDVAIKPKNIGFIEAGVLPLVALTSLYSLKLAGAPWKSSTTVLILGASSGTGHVAVQLAKALGATHVIVTARPSRWALLRSLGADQIVDYQTENWWEESVIPDGSLDAIYDTVLLPMTGDRAYRKLKDHGRFVTLCNGIPVCGAPMPKVSTRWKRPSLSAFAVRCMADFCASAENLDELRSLVEAGKLRGHLHAVLPFNEISHAVDLLTSGHVMGKVAIAMTTEAAVAATNRSTTNPPTVAVLA